MTYAYSRVVMDLNVPECVAKIDLHNAIESASAKYFIQQYPELNADSLRLEQGSVTCSMGDYLADGVHLKNPSYEIMYRLVMEAIERRWQEIIPQNMTMPVTWWGNLVTQTGKRKRGDEL
jgi:hypothetical protein